MYRYRIEMPDREPCELEIDAAWDEPGVLIAAVNGFACAPINAWLETHGLMPVRARHITPAEIHAVFADAIGKGLGAALLRGELPAGAADLGADDGRR